MNRFCASLMIVPRFVPLLPASWKEKRISSLSVEMVCRTYIQLRVAQLFLLPEVPNLIHWVGTTSVAIGGHLWHITGHHWPVHLRLLHHWHLLRLHHHLVVAHHVVPIRRCLKLVVQFGQTFVHLEKEENWSASGPVEFPSNGERIIVIPIDHHLSSAWRVPASGMES